MQSEEANSSGKYASTLCTGTTNLLVEGEEPQVVSDEVQVQWQA